MRNFYEILEVDKNASQEVIDKAYRTLAKKYHPDLQQGNIQNEYAEKMKEINEAYDVLSDSVRRAQYDEKLQYEELQNQRLSQEEQERILRENYELKQQLNKIGTPQQQVDEGTIINMSRILNEQVRAARKQAYHDAYIQDLRDRGYKIKYKHDLKYYFKMVIFLAITFLACFIIYQIPFVKNFFQNLYNENILFKAIVDIFRNTLTTKF